MMNENCKNAIDHLISSGWSMLNDSVIAIKEYGNNEFIICMYDQDELEYIVEKIVKHGDKYDFKYESEFFSDEENALEFFESIN